MARYRLSCHSSLKGKIHYRLKARIHDDAMCAVFRFARLLPGPYACLECSRRIASAFSL